MTEVLARPTVGMKTKEEGIVAEMTSARVVYIIFSLDDQPETRTLPRTVERILSANDEAWADRLPPTTLGRFLREGSGIEIQLRTRAAHPEVFEVLGKPAQVALRGKAGEVSEQLARSFVDAAWAARVSYEGLFEFTGGQLYVLHQFVAALASAHGGLVWNPCTDEFVTHDAFGRKIAFYDQIDLLQLVVLHPWWLDEKQTELELHTHGMRQLGMPELLISPVSKDALHDAARLVNEVAAPLAAGQLDLDASPATVAGGALQVALTPQDGSACLPNASYRKLEPLPDWATGAQALRTAPSRFGQPRAHGESAPADLLLAADIEARRARFQPTLARLRELWASLPAVNFDHEVLLQVGFGEAGGREWIWVELAGIGESRWRGILRSPLLPAEKVYFAPAQIANWEVRQRGRIVASAWKEIAS